MINLSFSCGENLENAPKTICGHYCAACKEDIFDFRGKSNEEIRDILKKDSNIKCGTFDSNMAQEEVRSKVNIIFRLAFAAVFIFGLNFGTFAQDSNCHTTNTVVVSEVEQSNTIQISGKIMRSDSIPLANASIWIENGDSPIKTVTDVDGNFVLDLSDDMFGKTIIVHFESAYYEEKTLKIKNLEVKNYLVEVVLEYQQEMTRGVIVRESDIMHD